MKLNWLQMSWLVGTALFFGALILDIVNVIELPGAFLIIAPIALFAFSVAVGPTFKEIHAALNRPKRPGGTRS